MSNHDDLGWWQMVVGSKRRDWTAQLAWCALTLLLLWLLTFQVRQTFADAHTFCSGSDCEGARLTSEQLHLLQNAGVSLDSYGVYASAIILLLACVYVAVAGVIIWRKPSDRMAVITAFTLSLFGCLAFESSSQAPSGLPQALWLPVDVLVLLSGYAMVAFLVLFPTGRLALRWPLLLILPLAFWQTGDTVARHSSLDTTSWVPLPVSGATWILMFGAVVYLQIYRYRHVLSPLERQQTKWAVFGIGATLVGFCAFAFYPLASMTGNALFSFLAFPVTQLSALIIPLSIGVAILRHRLWDVDLLINRTLVYGSLSATLGLVYIVGVVSLQTLFHGVIGQSSEPAIVISTLIIAALFQPLRRRIQAGIDRRFYRRKYDAARTLSAFGSKLRNEVDLDQLRGDLLSVVQDTMQPAHCSLWLRREREA